MSRLSEHLDSLLLRVTPTHGSGPSGKPRPAWRPAASGLWHLLPTLAWHVIDIGLFAQPVVGEGTVHSEVTGQAQGLPTAWLGVGPGFIDGLGWLPHELPCG